MSTFPPCPQPCNFKGFLQPAVALSGLRDGASTAAKSLLPAVIKTDNLTGEKRGSQGVWGGGDVGAGR